MAQAEELKYLQEERNQYCAMLQFCSTCGSAQYAGFYNKGGVENCRLILDTYEWRLSFGKMKK